MGSENVADLIAETLAQAGVKRIFGVVGDSLNGLTDALRKRKAIDWIHVRHEEVAAFAAAAEAQITGELLRRRIRPYEVAIITVLGLARRARRSHGETVLKRDGF